MLRRLGRVLTAVFSALWRFIGRVGLAFRNILTWFVYRPLFYLTMPFWLPLRWLWEILVQEVGPPVWHFLGQVGDALRRLINRLFWQPFKKFIIRPVVWYYRNFLRPAFVWAVVRPARAVWAATAVRRARLRIRVNSRRRLFRARLRLKLKRPSAPERAEIAPAQPRLVSPTPRRVRLVTAVAAAALLLAVGLLSFQSRQGQTAIADSSTPVTIILTPTPLPSTPTPVPTVDIRLTPWATPDPTTGGGAIAFAQTVNGNTDIYVLPVGQAEAVRVTTHPAADKDPAWSPDGSQLAFASHRDGNWEIYVYDIPSGRLQRVTRGQAYDAAPTWSPDGQWLAFESYRDENLDIYLVKANGREGALRLTYHPAVDFSPVWSPDGRHIAFTSWRSGNKDIFLQSLDDSAGEFVVNVTGSPAVHEDGAAFSPDGRFLAYHESDAGFPVVYAQPLTADSQVDGPPVSLGHQGEQPAWSPDGDSLVYVHEKNGRHYLVAGSAEAWGITPQVYAADGRLQNPSWVAVTLSPDMAAGLANIDGIERDKPLFMEAIARPERGEPPTLLFELPVNAPSPYLSDQVDQSFTALRERVIAEAGWDFLGQLDGMFEEIDAKAGPGQSSQSWNKAGRAFDFYYREAMGFDPQVIVVREEEGVQTYWRVFVKTAVQDGSLGEPLTFINWDFQSRSGDEPEYYEAGGKWGDGVPSGYYLDFTALAADYGWERVPAGENWRTYFPDIRFWHFFNPGNLTWEEAMAQLYSEAEMVEHFGP